MSDTELKQYKRSFLKDEVLIKEGEQGSEILLLEKGIVDVVIRGKKVNSIDASVSQDFIGEVGAILGMPRTATLIAATDGIVLSLPKFQLEAVLQKAPSLGLKLVRSLCGKLANSASALADFQTKNTSVFSSGSTEISLRNYMKGLLHLMEICADDQTGNMGKDLLRYFLTTNPWGLQHGDKKQVIDFKSCSIKVPKKIDSDELLS